MAETSAEIDDIFSQPTGVGLYDCHIEGLSFLLMLKLRVIPVLETRSCLKNLTTLKRLFTFVETQIA